jgi:hypothetical protein
MTDRAKDYPNCDVTVEPGYEDFNPDGPPHFPISWAVANSQRGVDFLTEYLDSLHPNTESYETPRLKLSPDELGRFVERADARGVAVLHLPPKARRARGDDSPPDVHDDSWIPEFLAAGNRRAARRFRGEPAGPTVTYADVDGKMQRVDSGADRSEMVIEVNCPCGETHEATIGYMSDDQIEGLLEHNQSRDDLDDTDRAALAELRRELERRKQAAAAADEQVT